jgi:uncharacterized damage-inducible protein DinB
MTKQLTELVELLEYHHWATNLTVNAARALTPEQFTQDLGSSFPSVRDTLVHVFTADRAWLGRLEGQAPLRANATDFGTLNSLLEVWEPVLTRWPSVVEALGDAGRLDTGRLDTGRLDTGRLIEYKSFAGEPFTNSLGQIVRHVVNHGTYHRGQVATMLRQLGAQAVSSDLISFYRERGDSPQN